MNSRSDNNTCSDARDDIIELGAASVETLGGGAPGGEELGKNTRPGLSEE